MGLKVVVTGASSGIGQSTALTFSKDGHEVYATGRSETKLAETARLAKEAGGAAVFVGVGDVGVEGDVQRNYAEAVKALGGVPDVVVLNAGFGIPSAIEDVKIKDYDSIFGANVRGVILWIKTIVPDFKKRRSGQIVIMNSVGGEVVLCPNFCIYFASKFALTGLAKALRLEFQGTGIKLGSIYPGVVDTPAYVNQAWKDVGIDNGRELFQVDKTSLSSDDVARAVTTIAYQSPRSDIEKLTVWQF